MAQLELRITLNTSESYDTEAAENLRARKRDERILATSDKLAEQVMKVIGGLGYVAAVDSCDVLHPVGGKKNERKDNTPATNHSTEREV